MRNDFEHQQEWWCPYSHEQHNGDYQCIIYNIPKKCDGKPGLYELCEHWRRQTDVDLEEKEPVMTNKDWLASLSAEEFYDRLKAIECTKGRNDINTRCFMIEWLNQVHTKDDEHYLRY